MVQAVINWDKVNWVVLAWPCSVELSYKLPRGRAGKKKPLKLYTKAQWEGRLPAAIPCRSNVLLVRFFYSFNCFFLYSCPTFFIV